MTPRPTLDTDTTRTLQEITTVNVDSSRAFGEASRTVADPQLAAYFAQAAQERQSFADELRAFFEWDVCEPGEKGSLQGRLHGLWIRFRGLLNDGDPRAVLAEAERAEQAVTESYEALMASIPASALSDVLRRHYHAIRKSHRRVGSLRELAVTS